MPISVLIVDDSEIVRKIIRNFLEVRTDWKISGEADSGIRAIDLAREFKPDLIILDFAMPEMNGIETACVLKNILPDSRIVIFTMFGELLGDTLTSAVGVDLVVSKPDGLAVLVRAAAGLLQGSSAEI
jgi:DNA-binding NarL/FixJ family response regulator